MWQKKLTSLNLLLIKRLTSEDLPTRTSPTKTTLQSCLTSVKRCLTLPIFWIFWSTLKNYFSLLTKKNRSLHFTTSEWLLSVPSGANRAGSQYCCWEAVATRRSAGACWQRRPGVSAPSTLARGWRSGLLSVLQPAACILPARQPTVLVSAVAQAKNWAPTVPPHFFLSKECQSLRRNTFRVALWWNSWFVTGSIL